jgi:methyl-accepting chemotaxis protein
MRATVTTEIGGQKKLRRASGISRFLICPALEDGVYPGKGLAKVGRAGRDSHLSQGVKYSEEAGGSLGVIVKSVDDLQLMVQQIASATEEMSATSDQISKDVEQIATISRETSNSSEQTALASGDLANLAASLQNIVGGFRL